MKLARKKGAFIRFFHKGWHARCVSCKQTTDWPMTEVFFYLYAYTNDRQDICMTKVHKGYLSRQALALRLVFLIYGTYLPNDALFATMTGQVSSKNFRKYL